MERQQALEEEQRLRQEELERQRAQQEEEERLCRLEEERRRKQEEMQEAQRRLEEQRREEEARALAKERSRKERLEAYLAKEGFKGVNEKEKTGMLSGLTYPLHAAVKANSAEGVEMLL